MDDDSYDSLDSEDEIDLKSLQYNPKKDAKPVGKSVVKPVVKPVVEKQIVKKAKSKPMKEMLSEDDIIAKRKIILLLQFYMIEFPVELKSFKKINMDKKNNDELLEIKREMDFTLGNNSGIKSALTIFRTMITTIEMLALNFTPLNCRGLSNICNDPDVIKDVKLIALKNSNLIQTEPEFRLIYKVVTSAIALHGLNPEIQYDVPNRAQTEDNIKNTNSEYINI